jgi:hypothetical protein
MGRMELAEFQANCRLPFYAKAGKVKTYTPQACRGLRGHRMKVRWPFAFTIHGMKTVVYVDGFNLHYRALRKSSHKWLNLHALCEAALPKACEIVRINYYSALVSGRRNLTAPRDQNAYLRALKTLPNLHVHLGVFQVSKKWMFLAQPVSLRPLSLQPALPNPDFAYVVKTEEKTTDVNLGTHLVRDAFTTIFEHAVVITDDTDLIEPLRIVKEEAMLPVTLLTPVDSPAVGLRKSTTHIRHLRPYLGVSQFPDPVIGPKGPIAKPAGW